jgi:hypothetical protein
VAVAKSSPCTVRVVRRLACARRCRLTFAVYGELARRAWLKCDEPTGAQNRFQDFLRRRILPSMPFASGQIQLVPLKRLHFCIRLCLFSILESIGNSAKRVLEKRIIPKENFIDVDTSFAN